MQFLFEKPKRKFRLEDDFHVQNVFKFWGPEQYSKSGVGQAFVLAVALMIAAAAQTTSAQDKPRDDDDANPGQLAYVANFGSQNTISGFA